MKKRGVSLFLLLLLVLTVAQAQGHSLSRSKIDSLRRMLQMQPDSTILSFEHNIVNLGVMSDTLTPLCHELEFKNVSGREVKIEKIASTCGCIDVEYSKVVVPVGGSGLLKFRFNPKGQAGTIDKRIFVYTDLSESVPATCVIVRGNVVGTDEWDFLPYKVGTLRMKSNKVCLDNVLPSQRRSMRIMCANIGLEPLKIEPEIIPQYATFEVEPKVLEPGFEGDIIISVYGDKLPLFTDEHKFNIVIGGVKGSPLARTIEVIIKNNK